MVTAINCDSLCACYVALQPVDIPLSKCDVRIDRIDLGQYNVREIDATISSLDCTTGSSQCSDSTADIITDSSEDKMMEYTEPSVEVKKEEFSSKETFLQSLCLEPNNLQPVFSIVEKQFEPKVKDYGHYRVTRSISSGSDRTEVSVSASESPQSFRAYKEKMQASLKAKLANASFSEGFEMDIDSDLDDDDPEWKPKEIGEQKDNLDSSLSFNSVTMDKYKCGNCDKIYQKSGHLLKHMKNCSGLEIKIEIELKEDSEIQCKECGVFFSTVGSMKRHVMNIHGEMPGGLSKLTRNSIQDLQKVATCGARKVLGEIVATNIMSGRDVNDWKKRGDASFILENLSKPLKCLECRRSFVKSGHLVKHMKVLHNSPSKFVNPVLVDPDFDLKNLCDLCQKSFATPASLRRHLKLHDLVIVKSEQNSPSKADFFYSCKECDKKYLTKPSLKRHILTDHRGFKSTCNICGMSVARLDNHMALVHQDQLSSCLICNKLLAPPCLARHVRTVHMGCLIRCVECDRFVSNIHKHMAGSHLLAYQIRNEGHSDHRDCDCVFYLGPSSFFPVLCSAKES